MTSANDNDDPPTAIGAGGEPTAVVPPAAAGAPGFAWSYEEPETQTLSQPWRLAWRQAAVIAACGLALAIAIGVAVFVAEQASQRNGLPPGLSPPPSAPMSAAALPPISSAAPPTGAIPAPPVTSTVTVVAPPAAGAGPAPPPAQGMFVICPSGHSGVATTVTSCAFADNVRRAYLVQGGPDVEAYSPVTGETYAMECIGGFNARLSDGQVVQAVRCTGGSNAVVVVW